MKVLLGVELVLFCADQPPDSLSSLAQACRAPLYYVRGNHDIGFEPGCCPHCIGMHARAVAVNGVTLLGMVGCHWYNGGPLQYSESEMRLLVRHARAQLRRFRRLDIVVAHAAPRGLGDGPDLCHRGFRSFRRLIDRLRPRFFLHGHIHRPFAAPSERVSLVGDTRVIDCGGHHLFELDDEAIPGCSDGKTYDPSRSGKFECDDHPSDRGNFAVHRRPRKANPVAAGPPGYCADHSKRKTWLLGRIRNAAGTCSSPGAGGGTDC